MRRVIFISTLKTYSGNIWVGLEDDWCIIENPWPLLADGDVDKLHTGILMWDYKNSYDVREYFSIESMTPEEIRRKWIAEAPHVQKKNFSLSGN